MFFYFNEDCNMSRFGWCTRVFVFGITLLKISKGYLLGTVVVLIFIPLLPTLVQFISMDRVDHSSYILIRGQPLEFVRC